MGSQYAHFSRNLCIQPTYVAVALIWYADCFIVVDDSQEGHVSVSYTTPYFDPVEFPSCPCFFCVVLEEFC
jgi:hypothetical protein